MQVYYAVWRTLEDVEPEFDFHDTAKFEAVGVADKYCITCEDCYTRYILFYSEYPECYELVAGEVVYQEESYGYDQLGKQIINIVNPIHGKENLDDPHFLTGAIGSCRIPAACKAARIHCLPSTVP